MTGATCNPEESPVLPADTRDLALMLHPEGVQVDCCDCGFARRIRQDLEVDPCPACGWFTWTEYRPCNCDWETPDLGHYQCCGTGYRTLPCFWCAGTKLALDGAPCRPCKGQGRILHTPPLPPGAHGDPTTLTRADFERALAHFALARGWTLSTFMALTLEAPELKAAVCERLVQDERLRRRP